MQAWLAEQGRGFRIRDAVIPIVPGAICFDLLNGGDKAWGRFPPYRDLGYAAAARGGKRFRARQRRRRHGRDHRELQGRAWFGVRKDLDRRAGRGDRWVNAVGSVTVGDGPWFWAAPFEVDGEFGGRGLPASFTPDMLAMRLKGGPAATSAENTTLAVVVHRRDADQTQAKRLAMIAQTGMARAIYPVHAPLDGDAVFAAATCEKPIDPLYGLTELGMVAANVLARAIARGVSWRPRCPSPARCRPGRIGFG